MPFTDFTTTQGATLTDDTGTRKDGTVLNKSWFLSLFGNLDSVLKSTTYGTTWPNTITDLVKDAYVGWASLKARLDAIADPTTGVPVAATFIDYLNRTAAATMYESVNMCANDDLLLWPNGDSAVPSYLTLSGGTPPTIARTGVGLGDTTTKVGPYSAKLTFGANPCYCYWTPISTTAAGFLGAKKGAVKFTFGMWVWSATGNAFRLFMDDGVVQTYSSYHTGGSAWQFLVIDPTTWSAAATQLLVGLVMEAAGSAYISGATCIPSNIPVIRHVPCPTETFKLVDHGIAGAVTTGTPKKIIATPFPCLIKETELAIVTVPTGQALICDLDWLDFSGGGAPSLQVPYSTKPQIAAAAGSGRAAPDGTYQYRCLQPNFSGGKKGGGLSLNVDQVGSGAAGSDLSIVVTAMRYKRPEWISRYGGPVDGY